MRAARIAWTVARDLECLDRAAPADTRRALPPAPWSPPAPGRVSSRKNGLPCVRSIEELLERLERRIVAEERLQQLPGALGRQRVEPELGVGGLAAPARAGTRAGSSRAAAGAPAGRLSTRPSSSAWVSAVDPVQVLEDQQQRLHLALAQQQPLDGVERALPALRRDRAPATRRLRPARRAARGAPGSVGSSARSSVAAFPVTFSRISRWSSRSPIRNSS